MRQAFSGLSWVRSRVLPEIYQVIKENGNIEKYKKGELIIPPRKRYDKFAIIESGLLCKAIYNNSINKNTAFSLLIPGRLLGTSYYMSTEKSNLYVKALRNTEIITVPFEFVDDLMLSDKRFMKLIHRQFSVDWESDLEGLASLSFFTPEEKLKILFKVLMLSYDTDFSQEWVKLPLRLSYTEMSNVIYTTRLTVIRIINHWKAEGAYRQEDQDRYVKSSFLNDVYDWKTSEL